MAAKPVPRKRRREKEIKHAKVISFIVGAMLLLAKLLLAFLFVLVLTVIVHIIVGNFSGLGRTAGSVALYFLIMWVIFCIISIIRIAIQENASGNSHKAKNHPDDTVERIDTPNRNTSRKRIAKQKTLARRASEKKKKQ